MFPREVGMPPELVPPPLPADIERVGVGGEFFAEYNAGRARAVKGEIKRFGPDFVELDTGDTLPADLVVFATGWTQRLDFLPDDLRADVLRDGQFQVYRHILPPRERTVGFVGYASSVAAQLTAEIGAHWLSQVFLGAVDLPSPAAMDAAIARVHAWAERTMPSRRAGYFVGVHVAYYIDDLLRDLGLTTRRRPDFIRENFAPLLPARFATLGEERRLVRAGLPRAEPYYLKAWHAGAALVALWFLL